jgi:hypothetical protein
VAFPQKGFIVVAIEPVNHLDHAIRQIESLTNHADECAQCHPEIAGTRRNKQVKNIW